MSEVSRKHVTLFLPALHMGGAERVMLNLARGFAERGLKVDLVLAKAEGPYLSQVPSEVRVVDLGAKRVLYSLPALVRYLRKERPQAMISTLNHANIIALWARVIARVPIRLTVREANVVGLSAKNAPTIKGRLMPALMRLFYPWADVVIANSRGVAEDLINLIKLPKEKVRVIYNPVITPELFVKAEEPLDHPWFRPGAPVILGVGRLTKPKDFPTLIRAFALVRKECPARLMILGEGEDRLKLEALARELGVGQDIAMPGFVDNPYKYMRRASVFVLSSQWEGFGVVLVEAMACGCPVVSTDCPSGPAEILQGGKYGILVPPGNPEKLAEAILRVLTDKNLAQELSEKGRQRAMDFTVDKAVEQYLALIKECLETRG